MAFSLFNNFPNFNLGQQTANAALAPIASQLGVVQQPAPAPAPAASNIIGNLPALRSGGGAEGSNIDPTLRPYLGMGLQRAEQLFFGEQQPTLFPGQMYVSPSQQTLDALARQEEIARTGAAPLAAAQQAYGQSLGGLGFTAGGGFLGGSPYRDMMIESATRPLMQQFEQSTLPALQSAFSRAGRYGSGAQARAIGQAQEATTRAIGDISGQIAAADYARERGLMQQALGQQIGAAQLAPQFFASQFLPSEQLAQVGAAQEAIEARPLQEAISRYQYAQQLPYSQLQSYLSAVYGNPMAGSVVPQQAAAQTNRLGSVLGGAALGAGAASALGGSGGLFGFSPTQTALGGAALGGLLGGFF
jgi:hypothetical protein